MDLPQLSNGATAAGIHPDPVAMEPAREGAGRARSPRTEYAGKSALKSPRPGWRQLFAAQAPLLLQVAAWVGAIAIVLVIKKFG